VHKYVLPCAAGGRLLGGDAPMPGLPQDAAPADLRSGVLQAIDAFAQTRSLGGVVSQVIAIANSPKGSLHDLAQIIERDPVLSARLLQLANSTAYSRHINAVATLDEAVRYIGTRAVRDLAMSAGILESFAAEPGNRAGLLRCWQHALAVAALMGRMHETQEAPATAERLDPGVVQLVGLCHDLGEILLRQNFPAAFAQVEAAALHAGTPLYPAVQGVFGISHDEVTRRLFEKLDLPQEVSDPICRHAHGETSRNPGTLNCIEQMLRIAEHYANGLLLASSPCVTIAPVLLADCRAAHVGAGLPQLDILRNDVLATTCALSRASADEEQEIFRPRRQPRPLRVWYARSRLFWHIDGIEALLGLLCKVDVHDALPGPSHDGAALGAIVVAAPRADIAGFGLAEIKQSLAGASCPVLWLLGQPGSPEESTIPGVQIRHCPLILQNLLSFVDMTQPQVVAA
jgi:HD-like signal output (HDOD) protein